MLTDKKAKAAKPRTRPYRLHDGHGLYLLVQPVDKDKAAKGGTKSWVMRYRLNGKESTLGLGSYVKVSLAVAREKHRTHLAQLGIGKDPAAEKARDRQAKAVTFKAVSEEWLSRQTLADATLEKARWMFKEWLFPALGSKPIGDIQPQDLLAVLRKAESQGLNETANRLRSRASQVFRFAIATGRAANDPAASLRGALSSVTVTSHPAITDPRKLGALLRAIDGYDGAPTVALALRIAPHVAVRPGELRSAEWQEFDFDAKVWRIPASKTKMRTEHLVPLSKQVIALLTDLQRHTGSGKLLFPGSGKQSGPISENTLGKALRKLGYAREEHSAHGFRSTFSTLLNEQGVNPDLIELCLAHRERNAVRRAYNRAERLPERQALMQSWSDKLDILRAMESQR